MRKFVLFLIMFCFLFVSCGKNPPDTFDDDNSNEPEIEQPADTSNPTLGDEETGLETPPSEEPEETPPAVEPPANEEPEETPPAVEPPANEEPEETPPAIEPPNDDNSDNDPPEEEPEVVKIISLTYNGETLVLYKGETPNFEGLKFKVNFSDGGSINVNFDEATSSNIDYTLDGETKELTLSYNSHTLKIPYKVTYRTIIEEVEYNFIDNSGCFPLVDIVKLSSNKLKMFDATEVSKVEKVPVTISSSDFEVLKGKILSNGMKKLKFYLINDTIYCDLDE